MSKLYTLIATVSFGVFAGCASRDYPADISLVLKGPHSFKLRLEKQNASPGEIVMAHLEFTNTGSAVLWVPTPNELFFVWERKYDTGSESSESLSSFCGGLQYKKLWPGQ